MRQLVYCGIIILLASCQPEDVAWEQIPSPSEGPIFAIHFVDEDTGFAVGGVEYESEKMLRTYDGGEHWELLPPKYGQAILDFDITAQGLGITGGIAGRILRTGDEGGTWQLYQTDRYHNLRGVAAVSDSLLVAAGGASRSRGELWTSRDGGLQWQVDTFPFELQAVNFPQPATGFACGYGAVIRTTDAGRSWQTLDVAGDLFAAIDFPSSDTGYIVGLSGEILRSTDGGTTWKSLRSASAFIQDRHEYHDVAFRSGREGYIVGKKSLILYTRDAGESWTRLKAPARDDFYTLCLSAQGRPWVAGKGGQIFRLQE